MRTVKCRDTGEFKQKDQCFKANNGWYFSTQEACDKKNDSLEYFPKCCDYFCQILNWQGQATSMMGKLIKCYGEPYSYKLFYEFLQDNTKDLEYIARTKDFQSTIQMIRYYQAVFENRIEYYYRDKQKEKKRLENIVVPKTEEIQDGYISTKDISKWLN